MPLPVRWLFPLYRFGADFAHIAVAPGSRPRLLAMGQDIAGSDAACGIYVPLSAPEAWGGRALRGRIVGAIRLLAMPQGLGMPDFPHFDRDGRPRWPYGWPCGVIRVLPPDDCRRLRDVMFEALGDDILFPAFASRFQFGPVPVRDAALQRAIGEAVAPDETALSGRRPRTAA